VLANILIIPVIFLFLDHLHKYFIKFRAYRKFFEFNIRRSKRKIEKHVGTKWQFIALFLLVAIPLPFTGGYTGAFLAWFFRLKRRKSYLAIFLGIITAGIIVTLASIGLFSLL
jgi:uncharacterized membrane protein